MIHDALDAWFDADDGYRAEYGLTTLATEHRFGPIVLTLPDTRTLRFRGAIDRVDAAADGRLFVFDYKTGKPYGVRRGTIRSKAAPGCSCPSTRSRRARSPARHPTRPVEAYYWFVGRGEDRWIGYAVDAATSELFDATLQAIVDGIEARLLPGPAGRTRAPVLHRLRVLRPRPPRHRRSLARLDPQGASARARRLRRR